MYCLHILILVLYSVVLYPYMTVAYTVYTIYICIYIATAQYCTVLYSRLAHIATVQYTDGRIRCVHAFDRPLRDAGAGWRGRSSTLPMMLSSPPRVCMPIPRLPEPRLGRNQPLVAACTLPGYSLQPTPG